MKVWTKIDAPGQSRNIISRSVGLQCRRRIQQPPIFDLLGSIHQLPQNL